jgi:glucose-6-phosphate 1-dehydrogenase
MTPNVAAPTSPCTFVLFGASGDLSQRLLLPSLFSLALGHFLPDGLRLLGFATGDWDAERFRSHIEESLRKFWGVDPPQDALRWLQERSYWQTGDFTTRLPFKRWPRLSRSWRRIEQLRETGFSISPSHPI